MRGGGDNFHPVSTVIPGLVKSAILTRISICPDCEIGVRSNAGIEAYTMFVEATSLEVSSWHASTRNVDQALPRLISNIFMVIGHLDGMMGSEELNMG